MKEFMKLYSQDREEASFGGDYLAGNKKPARRE